MNIRTGIFQDKFTNNTVNKWPSGWSFQAGGGHIDNIGNCFFEAFGEKYYIRGEGKDIIEAENNAFHKYNAYENCKHEFKRLSEGSDIGICTTCGCRMRDVFEILVKCDACNIGGATHYKNNAVYCFKHYKEILIKEVEEINKEKYLSEEDCDELFYSSKTLWIINKLEELNIINYSLKDKDILNVYLKMKNGYFEYLMELCKLNYKKYKSKDNNLHYVDIYEMVEKNESIYSGMFETYLVENKSVTGLNNLSEYKKEFEDFIKLKSM